MNGDTQHTARGTVAISIIFSRVVKYCLTHVNLESRKHLESRKTFAVYVILDSDWSEHCLSARYISRTVGSPIILEKC